MPQLSADLIGECPGITIFGLSGHEFCINCKDIHTIINPEKLNQPNLFSKIYPYLILKDLNIPLVNIHKYFDLKRGPQSKESRIIVVETDYRLYAFFVEKILEILTFDKNLMDKIGYVHYEGKLLLKGIFWLQSRTIHLPDFCRIAKDQFIEV